MASALPPLRRSLDIMPSPVPDRPGLLLRDPYRYSQGVLIIPPALVPCLLCFDGQKTELDLREMLVRLTGSLEVGEIVEQLRGALSGAGLLEDEAFARLREERRGEFARAPRREAAHAGSAYPEEPEGLRKKMRRYMKAAPREVASRDGLLGIAAPHVSPQGGWRAYRAAYALLGPQYKERTFVVLGTSHYGEPERFGLTRKPFATPLGETTVDVALVDWLADSGGPAVEMEDYCHAVEHSVEFQVLFLQHLYGPGVRILPVLCGPFARSTQREGRPEDDPAVARFFEALGELARREADRLFWVLGVDMAHIGRRYGDSLSVRAGDGPMAEVAERDRQRIDRLTRADASGFWELVRAGGDELRWCGASPLYTFLRSVAPAGGELLRYDQWNIDDKSVVSFAGLAFSREQRA